MHSLRRKCAYFLISKSYFMKFHQFLVYAMNINYFNMCHNYILFHNILFLTKIILAAGDNIFLKLQSKVSTYHTAGNQQKPRILFEYFYQVFYSFNLL